MNTRKRDKQSDQSSQSIRLAVLTDAVPDRNGVGSYYRDLIDQLSPRVGCAELIHPLCKKTGGYRYLTAPLPGDGTQRIAMPRPRRLWRAMKTMQPNVIVVPTPGPFGLAGLLLSKKLRIPLITGFHTHYEALADLYWGPITGKIAQRFLEGSNRLLFNHSKGVFANSPAMCDLAEKCGARSTSLMGTSVPLEYLKQPLTIEKKNKIERVLFAGRLAEEKNLPAFFECAKAHPDIQFTIAGDGPKRSDVEAQANNLSNLTAAGWVPREQLIDMLDAHDVLLLPSHVESFGTIALEAMTRGRIVIVSERCGIVEWPDLNESIISIRNGETAADALHRVCQLSAGERYELANGARDSAVAICDWNTEFWLSQLMQISQADHNDKNNGSRVVSAMSQHQHGLHERQPVVG